MLGAHASTFEMDSLLALGCKMLTGVSWHETPGVLKVLARSFIDLEDSVQLYPAIAAWI